MYFIKKNWGLLLSAVIFLAVVGYLCVRMFGERSKYNAAVSQRNGVESWFKQVNSDGWKILGSKENRLENAEMAKYNKDVAVGHYTQIQQNLLEQFSFRPNLPNTSSEAQDWLADKVDELNDYALIQNKMSWGDVGGRFNELAEQTQPIQQSDFPAVFRQLMIYERLIRHLALAGVKVVDDLYFPRWLATEDAGDYTVTPIVMAIQADATTIQTLVNNLTKDPTMLFFVRNMKFSAIAEDTPAEEYNAVVLERSDAATQRTQARMGGRGGKGDGGAGMGGGAGSSSRRSTRSTSARSSRGGGDDMMGGGAGGRGGDRGSRRSSRRGGDAGMGGGSGMETGLGGGRSGMGGSANAADLVDEVPTRRDYLVLRVPRQIALELTLDLMEYKSPEEESSEGESSEED